MIAIDCSVMEDEDVLQLLTGEDEFDADIDEMAEEELLRDDVISDQNRHHSNSGQNNGSINKSLDDEEEDDDRDSGRRGRFRSERIMSLASVPTRRREIPDSLDSVNVNLDKNCDKSNYNNRRHNQQNYRNFRQNESQNQRQHNFRPNKGLLPLPSQSMAQMSQPPQQQRMILIPPDNYGQQMAPNPNPMNTIHVNPHFRARMTNQFEMMSQVVRPQTSEPQMRIPSNVMEIQSRLQFPTQTANNSQQMVFNPQINNQFRPQYMTNNTIFNDQNMSQMGPPLHHHQQQTQPLLPHPQQGSAHQMNIESQWRPNSSGPSFQMGPNLGQHQLLMPQQMALNRPLNPNPMLSGSSQSNFNPNYSQQQPYPSNFQHILMAPNGMAPSFQMQNNFGNPFQPMESQRFSNQQNYNKMSFTPQQQTFQTPPNPQIHSNINMNQMKGPNSNICPQKLQNMGKRANIPFQSSVRPNKPIFNANDQQRSEAIKVAQMRTKRAKQLLTKKHQNVVKEVQIVKNSNPVPIVTTSQKKDKEIEAAVGVDDEYKQKLEEQKRLREEVLRKKEERRKAMAAQRQRETESKSDPQSNSTQQKSNPVRSHGQQQIATLLNRSPQPTSNVMSRAVPKRIVKTMTTEKPNTCKPVINRVVISNCQNPKRSVLIKGLAASTTELAVRKLCKPIGAIESCKISVSCGQKTATVTFVRSEDAIQFQSKYSRTLLDLSIIQVSLICQLQRNAFISKLQKPIEKCLSITVYSRILDLRSF